LATPHYVSGLSPLSGGGRANIARRVRWINVGLVEAAGGGHRAAVIVCGTPSVPATRKK